MHETRNTLPLNVRERVSELLNARLADAVDLHYQVKQAHWNVKGPHFAPLHELFDRIAEDVSEYADLLAERAVQLGAQAMGTARVASSRSSLKEYPLEITRSADHIRALSEALAGFGTAIRAAIASCDELGDADASDICTEISRGIDKWLWMVEAHAG